MYWIFRYFLMKKAEGDLGSLLNMKIIEKEFFSETEIIKILLQCLNGLAHLNKFNVSHRDIKPDNILLKNQ